MRYLGDIYLVRSKLRTDKQTDVINAHVIGFPEGEPRADAGEYGDFIKVVSFAAVIRVVTQRSSPLYIPFPLLLRTNNMHVLVSSPPIIFLVTFAKDQVSRKRKPTPYWKI